MEINLTNCFRTLTFILSLFLSLESNGQCSLAVNAGTMATTNGTAFTTWAGFGPGSHFFLPVLNGGSYAVSTCGASINTQLTGWNSTGTTILFYNDDNGPLCSGVNASINNYVPNFTDFARIQVSEFNCAPGGSASINVLFRQNNNLVFTSSNAALCSGQTRSLTATPANVGSTPGNYGNPGTFSGTGVSGNVFTAPTVTSPTNYTITYTFGYVSQTQTITVNPQPTVSIGNFNICSGNTITFTPSGASTYTYSNGSATLAPITNTNINVVGTSSLGCISSNTAVSSITVNPSPVISVNNGSICSGSIFTIIPSGASTYTFSNGSSTLAPTVNTLVNVVGTSSLGCVSTNTAVSSISVFASPVLAVNSGSICSGQSFSFVISPGGANSFTISSGSSVVSPTLTSTYSVVGTSTAGCISLSPAISNVTVVSLPTISVNSGSICSGNSFTIIPTGASSYTIQGGSAIVTPTSNTSYSVLGSNASGCLSGTFALSNVTVNILPIITVNSGSICNGQSFTINPSGANTYTIQGNNAIVSPSTNTTYTVTGTSTAGCVSGSFATSAVTVNSIPSLSVNSGTICFGQSFTISPSGANTYTIQGGNAVVSPTATSSFSINGTSLAGCSGNAISNTITVNALPSVFAVSNKTTICVGEMATLSASGALTYTWNTSATTSSINVSPTITTVYTVTGTDANNCANSITLTQNVSACTSIMTKFETNIDWQVFPNPNNGEFTIYSQSDLTISLINELGQLLRTFELNQNSNHQVIVKGIQCGIYFMIAQGKDQKVIKKLIVN